MPFDRHRIQTHLKPPVRRDYLRPTDNAIRDLACALELLPSQLGLSILEQELALDGETAAAGHHREPMFMQAVAYLLHDGTRQTAPRAQLVDFMLLLVQSLLSALQLRIPPSQLGVSLLERNFLLPHGTHKTSRRDQGRQSEHEHHVRKGRPAVHSPLVQHR